MRPYRVGVIGMGVISRFYVEALRASPHAALAAVCDKSSAKLEPFRAAGVATFEDYRALLAREDINAVVVTLPNDLHYAACRDAMRAGKHVCCEKPLTIDRAQADELVALSLATGRALLTAFHRRYNAHIMRALGQVRLEDIVHVDAAYLERIEEHAGDDLWYMSPGRSGGGCIADNGPNVFDLLSTFLGPLTVERAEVTHERAGVDLEARVVLTNARGARADVHLDWAYPCGERKDVLIHLRNGRQVYADMLAGFRGFKSSLPHEYHAIVADFVRAIKHGGSHGEEGRDAVRLVEEAYAAAARGQEVVV
jgi:predicted dehydrogenase